MGMKSYYVHYKNKYPQAKVSYNENYLEVSRGDELLLRLEKNGGGQIVDVSEELGLSERHDLSPIPKESRVWKLHKDGKVGKDELHEERSAWADKNKDASGKVLSMEEYAALPKENPKN